MLSCYKLGKNLMHHALQAAVKAYQPTSLLKLHYADTHDLTLCRGVLACVLAGDEWKRSRWSIPGSEARLIRIEHAGLPPSLLDQFGRRKILHLYRHILAKFARRQLSLPPLLQCCLACLNLISYDSVF